MRLPIRPGGLVVLATLAAGCNRTQPALGPTKPAEVIVDNPVVETVTEYEDFTGRAEAVVSVDIKARTTGYLKEIHFKDGADVHKGDLLFAIDAVTYQAEADRAEASLAQAKTNLEFAQADLLEKERTYRRKKTIAGVSQDELDTAEGEYLKAKAAVGSAEAAIGVAEASLRLARQNLHWTKVYAPFDGRLSRRAIDPDNLVKADETTLTSIVALDPIHVYFDVDDRSMLRIRRLIREGKMHSSREGKTEVQVGLPDEDVFNHTGKVNFVDNRLDAGAGTIRLRAEVPNPASNGNRLFSPGQFVRIRLPIGVPHPAVLVPEGAIGTDQGQKFVYVVNEVTEKDKETGEPRKAQRVAYKAVKLGQQYGPLREIGPESGLTPKDRVIVSGLQRVRPGAEVSPKPAARKAGKPTPPPSPAPAATAAEKPAPTPPAVHPAG